MNTVEKALKDVTAEELMGILPGLATGYTDEHGGVCFHTILHDDAVDEDQRKFSLVFDDKGEFKLEPGHVKTELAIVEFHIQEKGGFQTMLRMMLGNEKQATMMLMTGWINVTQVGGKFADGKTMKRTESFFSRMKWGEEALKTAFAEKGITLTDCAINLDGFNFDLNA